MHLSTRESSASSLMHFSTRGLPVAQRRARWEEHVQAFSGPCSIEFPAVFEGHLKVGQLAGFACARLRQNARSVHRSLHDLRLTDPNYYYLTLQLSGTTVSTQEDAQCTLRPGDLTLLDSRLPCAQSFEDCCEQLTVHLPRAAVDQWVPRGQLRVGTALRGAPAVVLHSLLRPVFEEEQAFNDLQNTVIADALVKLVAASWNPAHAAPPLAPAGTPLLGEIQTYMASNLSALDLSPQAVAAVHGVSVRHVHRLFNAAGTSFGEWLRNCRLARCAADLRDRAHSQRSITDIAFAWGFNESAHFSRAFKAAYGHSPRQYRQTFFNAPAATLLNN